MYKKRSLESSETLVLLEDARCLKVNKMNLCNDTQSRHFAVPALLVLNTHDFTCQVYSSQRSLRKQ